MGENCARKRLAWALLGRLRLRKQARSVTVAAGHAAQLNISMRPLAIHSIFILNLLIATALAQDRSGEDWPRFLGAHANGTSEETGLLDRWPAGGPPKLWDKAIGTGYSAPS